MSTSIPSLQPSPQQRQARLPTPSDFPPHITLTITPPPLSQAPANILILLHGLGDTNLPFTNLAKNLNLPYTAILSIRAPHPLPAFFTGSDTPSFHWGDDVLFDPARGEAGMGLDVDAGFDRAWQMLGREVLVRSLGERCGWCGREILILGFGQGGMVGLGLAMGKGMSGEEREKMSMLELGGVISIGARLPDGIRDEGSAGDEKGKLKTPVLLLGGGRSSQVTRNAVDAIKVAFQDVEYVKWAKPEDSMPRNREEMLPIMKFLARRLKSRAGVPEGAVEVGR